MWPWSVWIACRLKLVVVESCSHNYILTVAKRHIDDEYRSERKRYSKRTSSNERDKGCYPKKIDEEPSTKIDNRRGREEVWLWNNRAITCKVNNKPWWICKSGRHSAERGRQSTYTYLSWRLTGKGWRRWVKWRPSTPPPSLTGSIRRKVFLATSLPDRNSLWERGEKS